MACRPSLRKPQPGAHATCPSFLKGGGGAVGKSAGPASFAACPIQPAVTVSTLVGCVVGVLLGELVGDCAVDELLGT